MDTDDPGPCEITFYEDTPPAPGLGIYAPGRRFVPGHTIPLHVAGPGGEVGDHVADLEVVAVAGDRVDFVSRPVD